MSEKLSYTPQSEISHASLDKELYGMDMSDEALLRGRVDRAAANNVRNEMIQNAYEKARRARDAEELGERAVKNFQRGERGLGPDDPAAAFKRAQAERDAMNSQLEDAGKVDTLNGAFARELEKVTDEAGAIDVDKLNPNDLIRYKSALGPLLGEDAQGYEKRMEGVFGTADYIGTVAKLVSEGDAWRLMNIAKRNPGVNPLADKLLHYAESQQKTEKESR